MDSVALVNAALGGIRQRFDAANDQSGIQRRVQTNATLMNACTKRRDLRLRNALARDSERAQRELHRRSRKRTLFNMLATDVQEAVQITESRHKHRRVIQTVKSKADREKEVHDETAALLKDVILIDNGAGLQDARTQMDDVCCNCGSLMERNLQLSYLVCPNLNCGHMRWYLDTSTYNSSTYSVRGECAKNSPKCVTHFSTFLNVAQGKTTKRFSREFLMKIAFYCYVEGARCKEDITKERINRAQKYLGATEYNISTILKTQLRGDCVRLPPEVVKKFQLLFKALWPTFSTLKNVLDSSRSNMVNFNFVSRVLCRVLGYDCFLGLFDCFRMKRNAIKHSAFMRRMFHELGWSWEGISEIPDHVLDEYEAREGVSSVEQGDSGGVGGATGPSPGPGEADGAVGAEAGAPHSEYAGEP